MNNIQICIKTHCPCSLFIFFISAISLHTRISNNLNQYAKKANETGKLYEEDIAEIKMMNNEQTELLKKALEAVIHLYEEDSKKRIKWLPNA